MSVVSIVDHSAAGTKTNWCRCSHEAGQIWDQYGSKIGLDFLQVDPKIGEDRDRTGGTDSRFRVNERPIRSIWNRSCVNIRYSFLNHGIYIVNIENHGPNVNYCGAKTTTPVVQWLVARLTTWSAVQILATKNEIYLRPDNIFKINYNALFLLFRSHVM